MLATLPKLGKEWKVGFSIRPTGPNVAGWSPCLFMENFLEVQFSQEIHMTSICVRIKKRESWKVLGPRVLPQFDSWSRIELEHLQGDDGGHFELKILYDGILIYSATVLESKDEHEDIPVEILDTSLMASIKEVTVQTKICLSKSKSKFNWIFNKLQKSNMGQRFGN